MPSVPVNHLPSLPARMGFWTALVCVMAIYGWIAYGANHKNYALPTQSGFSSALSEAFLGGHTYLNLTPDPGLKKLADPFVDGRWVPRLHDASYFHDRYYLYFGPGAALLLVMPWRLLFGVYLTDGSVTAILATVGFLFGCAWLWQIWARWFATLPAVWLAAAVLIWGIGNYVFLLVGITSVYAVPIVFGYAICSAALWAISRAIINPAGRTAVGWFALGSFLWAAALAGRPNYLFSLPALAIPFFYLRAASIDPSRRGFFGARRLILAGVLPVATVGVGLAAYNWIRFGSVTEFGVHFQFAGSDQRATKLFELRHFWGNLSSYFFSFPELSPYFPFTSSFDYGYGILGCAPLAVTVCFLPAIFRQRWNIDPAWRKLALTLLAMFLLNLVSMLGIPWANERYFADFVPPLMLLACMMSWFLLATTRASHRLLSFGTRTVVVAAGLWTLVLPSMIGLTRYPDREALKGVTRTALRVAHRIEELRHIEHGPLHLDATFQPQPAGLAEPLVVSGHGRDILFVKHLENNQVQFGFFHAGNAAVLGEPIVAAPGIARALEIDLGSLYPPPDHPLMRGFNAVQVEQLGHAVTVVLDGVTVLHTHSIFYATHPGDISIGSNPGNLLTTGKFSGKLLATRARSLPQPADLAARRAEGPVRLTVTLPPFGAFRREPLVSTGQRGAGDVVYVSYVEENRVRFGHDSWNGGSVETEIVAYDPGRPQEIEIDMGSLRRPSTAGSSPGRLTIRMNGRPLLEVERPFNPSLPEQIVFGFNGMGSSIVAEAFSGHLIKVETLSRLPELPPVNQGYGPAWLTLTFPPGLAGRSEPLLVSGRSGKGDLVYVTYVDESHVQFGIDHWGVGMRRSLPTPVDFQQPHTLEISIGSLFPEIADAWWKALPMEERRHFHSRVQIKLDGVTVLDETQAAHPSTPGQVVAGANAIGGSSCSESFTGKIFAAYRTP